MRLFCRRPHLLPYPRPPNAIILLALPLGGQPPGSRRRGTWRPAPEPVAGPPDHGCGTQV